MTNGKGSTRRPLLTSTKAFNERWEATFGESKEKVEEHELIQEDPSTITLSGGDALTFLSALENPPAPNAALKKLISDMKELYPQDFFLYEP